MRFVDDVACVPSVRIGTFGGEILLQSRLKSYCRTAQKRLSLSSCKDSLHRAKPPGILGISYPTLKQWIYHGKIKSAKTPGGHHRVPESEIDRLIPKKLERGDIATRRGNFRKISGRNQLIGRVVAIKFSGLLAQITLAIGEQHITSIITADAAKEMRLKPGERAAALIKSTEVMILRV